MVKVLVNAGKRNFPEDVAEILKAQAEVVYMSPSEEGYQKVLIRGHNHRHRRRERGVPRRSAQAEDRRQIRRWI